MKLWSKVQSLPWWGRWPIKWAIVAIAVFVVSFPNPRLFSRHLQHWRNPNAMIDADLPELQPLVEEVKTRLKPEMDAKAALRTVERFVYEKVPYAWDWESWGAADYLPTLGEALHMGREDCDGRAVVAASILANLGYKAELVTDFAHVWVKTEHGETMGARRTKSVEATPEGLKVNKAAYFNAIKYWAYGLSVFPFLREFVVLLVVWAMFLWGPPGRTDVIGYLLLLCGLLFLRLGGLNPDDPAVGTQLLGYGHWAAALVVLLTRDRRSRGRARRPLFG